MSDFAGFNADFLWAAAAFYSHDKGSLRATFSLQMLSQLRNFIEAPVKNLYSSLRSLKQIGEKSNVIHSKFKQSLRQWRACH
jgi:hypothetical protein